AGGEIPADGGERRCSDGEGAAFSEIGHQVADGGGVAAIGLEQEPLEIGGDLDVHRRRGGGLDAAPLVAAARQRAGEDVVDIGGDDELRHRQAHQAGDVAGEDIAKVAGGDAEGHGNPRGAEGNRGGDVIDDL